MVEAPSCWMLSSRRHKANRDAFTSLQIPPIKRLHGIKDQFPLQMAFPIQTPIKDHPLEKKLQRNDKSRIGWNIRLILVFNFWREVYCSQYIQYVR
ncbi:hypothetical protein J6590_086652 [Homalodisca vitripennis]|nr:hypothetical protein J6590_086652 [Homalodisca vitripennis]